MTRRHLLLAVSAAMVIAVGACRRPPPVVSFDFARGLSASSPKLETRSIDFGTPAARAHLLHGWSVDERWEGGTTFVWALGPSSTLGIFRFTAGPLILRLSVRQLPGAVEPQAITVLVNGLPAGSIAMSQPDGALPSQFDTRDLRLDAALLRMGENVLEFRYRTWRQPQPGDLETRPLGLAWDSARFGPPLRRDAPVATATSLSIPFAARLDYLVTVPPRGHVAWQGLEAWDGELPPSSELDVEVRWEDARAPQRASILLARSPGPFDLPFDNSAGGRARISFTARADSVNPAAAGVTLFAPVLLGDPEPAIGPLLQALAGLVR